MSAKGPEAGLRLGRVLVKGEAVEAAAKGQREAIGDQLTCVFVDHRLTRWGKVSRCSSWLVCRSRGWLAPAFLDRLDLRILVNAFALRALQRPL
jgi:hypothetical protein